MRTKGFEPILSTWKEDDLPLIYIRFERIVKNNCATRSYPSIEVVTEKYPPLSTLLSF